MPPDCHSVIREDVNRAVGSAIITRGEIVAQRGIPRRLPIDHQSRGNFVEFAIEFLSEVCLARVATTIARIAVVDAGAFAILTDQGINCLVSNRFTTAHILLVIVTEIVLVVSVDELQHVIQSIVLIDTLIDECHSLRVEGLAVVRGQGHGHLLCLVDLISIVGQAGGWRSLSASSQSVTDRSGSLPSLPGTRRRS